MANAEDDRKQLLSGIYRFALELYKRQGKRTDGNIFLSPISISAVLNMACLGAKGETLDEMKAGLYLSDLDDSKLHQAFSELSVHLKKHISKEDESTKEPIFRLYMANRLYGDQSYQFLEEFQTACKKYYDSELTPVNFVADPEKTAVQINEWVSETTNQKIKDIISKDFIDDTTRLILVNAIYFKSAWQSPFVKGNTQEADFFVSPQETIRVQLMFRKIERARYNQSSSLHCQIIKLPYLYNRLSMFVLLPDKTSSLDALEEKLSAGDLEGIDDLFQQHPDVNLWLPRFKIEETLELKEILCSMGMKSVFSMESADLSGIDGTRSLYASKVVHKAFVDVNEEGTEAAAATVLGINTRSIRLPNETVDFRADRPFLFFIREEETKAILFLGRALKP